MCQDIVLFSKTGKIGRVFDFLSQARGRGSRTAINDREKIIAFSRAWYRYIICVSTCVVVGLLRLFLYGREAVSGTRAVTAEGCLSYQPIFSSLLQKNCDLDAIVIELQTQRCRQIERKRPLQIGIIEGEAQIFNIIFIIFSHIIFWLKNFSIKRSKYNKRHIYIIAKNIINIIIIQVI